MPALKVTEIPEKGLIVYGLQACGKTHHAAALAAHFECKSVVDDWHKGQPITPGALHLTYQGPDMLRDYRRVYSFTNAMKMAGLIPDSPILKLQGIAQ